MSDDEYDDELPPISVNSSTSSSNVLCMPSAEELASQRAREAECERELLTLRAQHEVVALTDSSGSEGEAALAAAVGALALPGAPSVADSASPLPALLARLTTASAPALAHASAATLAALTDDVCLAVEADCVHSEEEIVFATAWLCACAAGAGGGERGTTRRARRALHHLLETEAFENISEEAFQMLTKALVEMTSPLHIRMEMADVLTSIPGEPRIPNAPGDPGGRGELGDPAESNHLGESNHPGETDHPGEFDHPGESNHPGETNSGGPRTRLALALLWATVSATLGVSVPQNTNKSGCACALASSVAAGGRPPSNGVNTAAEAIGARAVGRLARLCRTPRACAAAAARLLQHQGREHAPHKLQMMVSASKLQLLFRE